MDFLMLFGVGFSTGLAGAMIPGPLFLYTVSEAFRHGRLVGVKIAAGHLLLEAVFVAAVVLGLRGFLSSALFREGVAWIGGAGLVTMGVMILAKARAFSLTQRRDLAFPWGPWIGGACFSLASPGFLVWWATIGSSVFLQGALRGMAGVLMVAAGHALADVAWGWFVAFSVERAHTYCTDRTYRAIMACMAVWLIVLGAGFIGS